MSIIIRLQNLPWSANSADIRHFFDGLDIPDGGVHIIGGTKGDAFIAFKNDDHARKAMLKDGMKIKDSPIKLFLSSHIELQLLIEKVQQGLMDEGPLPGSEEHGTMEVFNSLARNTQRATTPEKIPRRKSLERGNRKLSPGRIYRRKSPENFRRQRSSERFSRKRSPEKQTRRKSPEKSRRASPTRKLARSRSPVSFRNRSKSFDRRRNSSRHQSRSPPRVSSVRSRSPHNRHRSPQRVSYHRSRSPHHFNRSRPERRVSPPKRKDSRSRSAYSNSSRNNMTQSRQLSRERIRKQSAEREVRLVDATKPYERRSPNEKFFTDNVPESNFHSMSQEGDIFSKYIAGKRMREGISSSDLQAPYSDFASESRLEHEQKRVGNEFDNRFPSYQDSSMQNRAEINPLHEPFHPPLKSEELRMSDEMLGRMDLYHEPHFAGKFSISSYAGDQQEMNIKRDELLISHVGPRDRINDYSPMGFRGTPENFIAEPSRFGPNREHAAFESNVMPDPFHMKYTVLPSLYKQPNYCIIMSGFKPNDNFKDVQSVLKGVYAPQHNIKWEVSDRGYKTGIVFVKMSNKEDFISVLNASALYKDDDLISVRECPDDIYWEMFPQDRIGMRNNRNRVRDLVYMLKGLPYATTENDVINFFKDLKLVDLLILYDKNGKATGTGFVEFDNPTDFEMAFERNGKKIGHRYIELLPSSREDIEDAKKTAENVSKPLKDVLSAISRKQMEAEICTENPFWQPPIPSARSLCVLMAGLPMYIRDTQIFMFFKDCGIQPHVVHILLADKRRPNGRAFAEFNDPFDLDVALKQHGKLIDGCPISIKQILCDEMVNILSNHEAIHSFGNRKPLKRSMSPVPEKAPYIWEPPDDVNEISHDVDKFSKGNFSSMSSFDNSRNNVSNDFRDRYRFTDKINYETKQVFDYGHYTKENMQSGMLESRTQFHAENPFSENSFQRDKFNQEYNSPSNISRNFTENMYTDLPHVVKPERESYSNQMDTSFDSAIQERRFSPFSRSQRNFKPFSARNYEERMPVKFGMKSRQPVLPNSGINDAFNQQKEGEMKMKLRKLSPVKAETKISNVGNTDKKRNDKNGKVLTSQSTRKNVRPSNNANSTDSKFAVMENKPTNSKSNTVANKCNATKDNKPDDSKNNKPNDSKNNKPNDSKNNKPDDSKNNKLDDSKNNKPDDSKNNKPDDSKNNKPDNSKNNVAVDKSKPAARKTDQKGKEPPKNRNVGKSSNPNGKGPNRTESRGNQYGHQRNNRSFDKTKGFCQNEAEFYRANMLNPPFGTERCVVQAGNVHPNIELEELFDFFHDFNIQADNIIRRFTDCGEPTGDIRIAFSDPQEAERAVRALNYKALRGQAINMFIV